jgi:hypothetical protein
MSSQANSNRLANGQIVEDHQIKLAEIIFDTDPINWHFVRQSGSSRRVLDVPDVLFQNARYALRDKKTLSLP